VKTLLERHFDTAFDAPDGIKRLRELILTLAMQGKLVKQDPNDLPASELLKEIEAEKRRLIKAGKIKQPKPLPPINPEEIPYKLPKSWEWVRLPTCYFSTGNRSNQIQTKDYLEAGQYPVVDQGKTFIAGYCNDSKKLLNIDRPYIVFGDHTKNIKFIDFDFVIGADGVKVLCPYKALDTKFIYHLIQSYDLADRGYARHFKVLNENLVPLPPLPEQHRIVAKIDQLMARCDALEKLRAERDQKRLVVHAAAIRQLLDPASVPSRPQHVQHFLFSHFPELYAVKENVSELRKAILQLAVMGKLVKQDPNDPPASELIKEIEGEKKRLIKAGTIKQPKPLPPIKPEEITYGLPKSWQWVRMGELCNGVTSGSTPAKNYFHDTIGVPFLKVYNIRNQKIDFEYRKQFIDPNYHSSKMGRSKLAPGNLIMNIVGPPLGKIALIPDDYSEYNCNQAIVVFRPIVMALNKYLYVYLLAGTFLNEIELVGTAGQDNISVTKSQLMPIPLPPLAEQHRIVAKIDQLMALCDAMENQIASATDKQTALLTALMAKL
jgi:type I restriction enzyme S subunit